MKVLKIIEKVFFTLAVVLGAVALAFSLMLDEGVIVEDAPMANGLLTVQAAYFGLGGLTIILLLVGGLLRYSNNDVARRVGEGFVIAVMAVLLGCGLHALVNTHEAGDFMVLNRFEGTAGLTLILGLVAAIVYAQSAILRGIIAIVKASKPQREYGKNADEEEQIRQVLRWKELQNKGIITAEEFEEKRQVIFGLKKEEEPEPLAPIKK